MLKIILIMQDGVSIIILHCHLIICRFQFILYSSYCPPDHMISDGWDEINYILNHKYPGSSWSDIHKAVNQFVSFSDTVPMSGIGIPGRDMYEAALVMDPNWMSKSGDVIAVLLDPIKELIDVEFPDE